MKTSISLIVCCLWILNIQGQVPVFDWAVQAGSPGSDIGHSLVLDASGNIYNAGWFRGTTDFDPSSNTYNLSSAGICDMYVQKLDSTGKLIWAKKMGGSGVDRIYSIDLDKAGNLVLTGKFSGTSDLDPGPLTYNLTSAGGTDIFVAKLDTAGNFVWAHNMGSIHHDIGYAIDVDDQGNIITTGFFHGTANFGSGTSSKQLISGGGTDVFIQKLNSSGSLMWVKSINGSSNNIGYTVTTDSSGNVYTGGEFQATTDFDMGSGTYNITASGGTDGFLHKSDASGNFLWAKTLNSLGDNAYFGITVDESGYVYSTGWYVDCIDFDPGNSKVSLCSINNSPDCFIEKSDASGNLIWAKTIGSPGDDYGQSISVSSAGDVYSTGYFELEADFDPDTGTYNMTSNGDLGIYIHKTDNNGTFKWARQIGGKGSDVGFAIATDNKSSVYTLGVFSGQTDSDPGVDTFNLNSAGDQDIVIMKLKECHSKYANISIESCNQIISPSGKYIWSNSGIYKDTLRCFNGCDSVLTINLNIYEINTGIDQNFNTLSALQDSSVYQWLDCDHSFTPVTGANAKEFNPIKNGVYAVEIVKNGCRDTSACYTVNGVGINQYIYRHTISIYPNPADGVLNLVFPAKMKEAKIQILSLRGNLLREVSDFNGYNTSIDVGSLPPGFYFINISEGSNVTNLRFLKK